MAVGVSCAGTGMRAALDLLSPLLTDAVDFVRQGALIANALVLMQQPESKVLACSPLPSAVAIAMSRSAFSLILCPGAIWWDQAGHDAGCRIRLLQGSCNAKALIILFTGKKSSSEWAMSQS